MTTLKRQAIAKELDSQAISLLTKWMSEQLHESIECKTREEFYQVMCNGIRLGLWLDVNKPSYGLKHLLHLSLPSSCTTASDLSKARENLSFILTAIRNIYRLQTIDLFESADFEKANEKDNILSCLLRLIVQMPEAPKDLQVFSQVYLHQEVHKEEEVVVSGKKEQCKADEPTKEPEWKPETSLDEMVYKAWNQTRNKQQISIRKEREEERGKSGVYAFQRHKVIVTTIRDRPFVQVGTETLPLTRFLDGLQK